MKNRSLRLTLALTTALVAAGSAMAQEKVVHVYNWSDYIDESILTDFTKETGIKVVYDVFDSNELVETKLLAGSSGYDVVVPTGPFLARQINAGVFQKLDKSKLPNLKNMWPEVSERLAKYDPGNEYAVNYMWGTTGIGYNVAKVKAALGDVPVDSWDILFKPENAEKLKSCGINILDASDETFAIAMNYLGKNPDSKETADLEAGGDVYMKIRPYVKTFNSSAYIDELANGDSCITIGWSGDILQAKSRAEEAKNGVEVNYVIPKEGTLIWFDAMMIPEDAPNPDLAHKFIDYVLRADVEAEIANYVAYATPNLAAMELVDPSLLEDPGIYPPQEVKERLRSKVEPGSRLLRTRTRLWTKLKTGQ